MKSVPIDLMASHQEWSESAKLKQYLKKKKKVFLWFTGVLIRRCESQKSTMLCLHLFRNDCCTFLLDYLGKKYLLTSLVTPYVTFPGVQRQKKLFPWYFCGNLQPFLTVFSLFKYVKFF